MPEDLLERRRELLRRRLAEQGLTARAEQAPPSGPSAAQRRMWLAQNQDPESSTLNICLGFRLVGDLDAVELGRAVAEVSRRHEALRTTFELGADGELRSQVHEELSPAFALHDLSELSEPQSRAQRLQVLARRDFARPFDLSAESPLRVSVFRLGPDEHVLALTAHHIAWDDDSWSVFFHDVDVAYRGGELPPPEPEPEASPASAQSVAYWRDELARLPEPLELPGAAGAGSGSSPRANRHEVEAPAELAARLEEFADEVGATSFMVLLAAFAATVRRHCPAQGAEAENVSEFFVSVPVGGRGGSGSRIGYFGNVLLLRCSVDAADSLRSLARRTRELCLAAFAHQDLDLSEAVAVGAKGSAEAARVGFSVRGAGECLRIGGMAAERIDLRSPVTQLPLSVAVEQGASGAVIEVEHRVDVVPDEVAAGFARRYARLLAGALAEPDRPLSQIDLLGAERAEEIACSCGAPAAPEARLLHVLIEERIAAAPDAVALVWDGGESRYGELGARANRLARWLVGRGVGAEDVVALQLGVCVEFIPAVLAVLKAGGAFVPVDPAYPRERIEHMLSDARPKLVLDAKALAEAEAEAEGLADHDLDDTDRARPLRPENLAYIVYTSGSTGKPKGVAVAHREIAAHMRGMADNYGLGAEDRLVQLTSVSFDASFFEIFTPLIVGASVVVPEPGVATDVPALGALVARHGVTVMHMVPSLLDAILALPEASALRTLRRVPVGGEALSGELVAKAGALWGVELDNFYGPTEAVVCATGQIGVRPAGAALAPIGKPLAGARAYLLDDALELVPSGVVGEIYLGGEHLARGYLGSPALTAERFVADPFCQGARMYRTGDLARRNAAGQLEFVGRADEQVKIRGFRIELGEVAAAVAAHPDVAQCVVVAADLPGAGKSLVAYVTPSEGSLEVAQIKAQAATVLPAHMRPAVVMQVDRIPLTPSGKLDRKALPEPQAATSVEFRPPATEDERRLAEIFASVLGVERVGADDSFFDLGGHSLLATRLVARIRAEFGFEVPVRAPFDAPTPAELAAMLTTCRQSAEGAALTRRPRPERVPLSYAQLAIWFQQRLVGGTVLNIPFAARLTGPLDVAALAAAFGDVLERHEVLRTTFPEADGVPYQLVLPPAPFEFSADVADHVFDLARELPIRAGLVRNGAEEHVLTIVVHHIAADHWSAGVLFADLSAAYQARLGGRAPTWEPLAAQYADFALWQQERFAGSGRDGKPESAEHFDYWVEALAGAPRRIDVAHDKPRPPVLGVAGGSVEASVPFAVVGRLRELARAESASEFMVLQAAVALLLRQFGAGEDIPIGSPVSGRSDLGADGLVGVFANMVVLRADVSGDPTARELVRRSRRVSLDAYQHQDLPIERLVETISPQRSRSYNPLFQVMMHYREAETELPAFGEHLAAQMLRLPFGTAYLDLSFNFFTSAEEVSASIVYNTDLYERATAQRLLAELLRVLEVFADDPDSRVGASAGAPLAPAPVIEESYDDSPPATPTERTLAALLEELLEIDDIRRGDGFFALGGDSVLSVQWARRANDAGLALTPQMVFEHASLSGLAAAVDAADPAQEQNGDRSHAPMSVSGLSEDMLASLAESWQAP
ncbi:non-ribosomal peptide synthetase [Segniliparus rugosus]|uniref:Amino acid adenylation domain-containing protein n=1 Tax=Segniliparus rugosus (strain ATCC BAA-974 / DSM 45345 / CCUG 50838 / CIP 108380 / JCM 13579 / CDC 945) TaxID=679197 RepID=E5XLS5_SEGRC|nr:non-ribosomal peptide synthetase [Segniliparus rugosus]EFV14753.1 amino acid adenylation domain-containing protein [Segniliparus rugosus ATCC BAA-974]